MKRLFAWILSVMLLLTIFAPAASAEDDTVTVVVDGTKYTAHIGDVIRYTYSLDIGGIDAGDKSVPDKITEIEGAVSFNSDSLKLLTPLQEDDNGNYPEFPALAKGSVMVNTSANRIKYNGVKLKGFFFGEKTILLQLDFEVIGRESPTIDHQMKNLGSGDAKLIYMYEVLIAPHTAAETALYEVGNVDMDDVTTIIDATEIQMFLCEMKELSPIRQVLADFNGDGKIVIDDATALQRKVADLPYVSYR